MELDIRKNQLRGKFVFDKRNDFITHGICVILLTNSELFSAHRAVTSELLTLQSNKIKTLLLRHAAKILHYQNQLNELHVTINNKSIQSIKYDNASLQT